MQYAHTMLGASRQCHYVRLHEYITSSTLRGWLKFVLCLLEYPSWVAEALPRVIMEDKATLGGVIAFLKVYLTFACCWPLPSNATKLQRLLRTGFRYFCCANSAILSIAATWTLYKHSDDVLLVMKLGCQVSAVSQVPLQLILFALQDKRLQVRFLCIHLFHEKIIFFFVNY